jgi:hypothetical protein
MTPQRRRGPRAKQAKRPSTGPHEARGKESKPISVRTQLTSRPSTASTARPSAVPAARPGGAVGRPAASATATAPALGPGPALTALPPAEPTLLERAERLRDDILRSKLTHPDPWTYTAKARTWGGGIQALVEEIAVAGQTPELHARFATLSAEVEGDPDFQRARQLF